MNITVKNITRIHKQNEKKIPFTNEIKNNEIVKNKFKKSNIRPIQ